MNVGDQVIVTTSKFFADQVGIVDEITNQGSAKIVFGEQVGLYTIALNTFILVKKA